MENNDIFTIEPRTLHENEFYTVHAIHANDPEIFLVDNYGCPYKSGYALVSKDTGIIELVRTTLPDILYNAEHFAKVLADKAYMWLRSERPGGETADAELVDFKLDS